jgi:hypothetical protein
MIEPSMSWVLLAFTSVGGLSGVTASHSYATEPQCIEAAHNLPPATYYWMCTSMPYKYEGVYSLHFTPAEVREIPGK